MMIQWSMRAMVIYTLLQLKSCGTFNEEVQRGTRKQEACWRLLRVAHDPHAFGAGERDRTLYTLVSNECSG